MTLAFVLKMPQFLGKKSDGHFAVLSSVLLFPYLLWTWCAWKIWKQFNKEPPWVEVHETLVIGSRPSTGELPEGIDAIIDLTAEFSRVTAPSDIVYRSFPILDGTAPSRFDVELICEAISSIPGRRFIHGAYGYLRTGLIASALLVREGHIGSKRTAVRKILSLNSGIEFHLDEMITLVEFSRSLRQRREEDETTVDSPEPPSLPESTARRSGDRPS